MAILGTIVLNQAGDKGFADAVQTAFYVGAGVMYASFLLARFFMVPGKPTDVE
jgi:hypothetical protein